MNELQPVNTIQFKGETIKDVIYIEIAGGWKMFIIFESGRAVILPVHPTCPVQDGSVAGIKQDIEVLEKQKEVQIQEINKSIEKLRNL